MSPHSLDQRYKGYRRKVAFVVGGLALLINLLIRLYWPPGDWWHFSRELLEIVRELALVLSEAALVASIIGILVEYTHLGQLFGDQLARALVKREFLENLTPDTLEHVSKDSYYVRNEKKVDNPFHRWHDYFDELWTNFSPLPIGFQRHDYKAEIKFEFFQTSEELARITSNPNGIPPLVRTTFTLEYGLVSPSGANEAAYQITSSDTAAITKEVRDVLLTKECISYDLKVDYEAVNLKDAVTHESNAEHDHIVSRELSHPIRFTGRKHVKLVRTTIECAAGCFFSARAREPSLGISVCCTSNLPCHFLLEIFGSNNQKRRIDVNTSSTLQFAISAWLNPFDGFVVVPLTRVSVGPALTELP